MSPSHEMLRDWSGLYVLDALMPAERAQFEAHLAECEECRAECGGLRPVARGLARAVPQVDPPPALRERVIRAATKAATPSGPALSPARRPSANAWPWLAVAASLAAVALGAYAMELRSRDSDREARLQDALNQVSRAQSEIADARRAALDAQAQVAVLAAPDLVRIDLAGQTPAPAARGRALWSRSRGMIFTASSLPPLPAGRVYQLWVLTAAGPPISVGVLPSDRAGALSAVFQTPPDIPPPAGVAVSDEPEGGVPAPTGRIWVAGKPVA